MAKATFYSSEDAEIIEVEFLNLDGEPRSLKLLVDSGFTGKSSFVLPEPSLDLVRAEHQPAQAVGALQGQQSRAWVLCRIPAMNFRRTLVAIIAEVSSLSLPSGVEGLAGLSFLRQFTKWGAEQTQNDGWRFYLSDGNE